MSLELSLALFFAAFSALFTILDPFGAAAVFLAITRGDSLQKKKMMAKKAAFTAGIVLIIFALAGSSILNLFSITIEAFKIAGGIIVASVGYHMIQSKRVLFHTKKEKEEAIEKEDISIIPLAIPLMSGPGAMTTAIVLMGHSKTVTDMLVVILAIVFVCFLSYLILSNADIVDKRLGETGRNIIGKIMGLIVMVVGVQFVINGIEGIIPKWFELL